jgi:hypothetical protein
VPVTLAAGAYPSHSHPAMKKYPLATAILHEFTPPTAALLPQLQSACAAGVHKMNVIAKTAKNRRIDCIISQIILGNNSLSNFYYFTATKSK